jgi:PPK2 family polyphosphate:nucleotide phosphotransferase
MTSMTVPDLESRYRVRPGRFRLADHDPADTAGLDRTRARKLRTADVARLRSLQGRLYAEQRQSLLVVLQGLDASGKDGTIAHVMRGVNPLGVQARAFGRPTPTELAHDWLWRCVLALPERGHIGIFNRSHYEEVTAVRVHGEYLAAERVDPEHGRDERFWEARYKTIAAWERHLAACDTRVVKFFLHISREKQRERLLARATDPEKQWKFSADDVAERRRWDAYQAAYEAALRATSTRAAPWYAIPADHKWLTRTAVAQIVVHHLELMDPRHPEPDEAQRRAAAEAVRLLLDEG